MRTSKRQLRSRQAEVVVFSKSLFSLIIQAMSQLELKLAERRNGRRYPDFVVDGESLFDVIGHQFDTVSCLAQWPNTAEFQKDLGRLLLREPADFPNNRRSLYVCGECGGLDCGAVSILISEEPETITWHSFGYERDWEDNLEEFPDIGPFVFNKAQYDAALEKANEFFAASFTLP